MSRLSAAAIRDRYLSQGLRAVVLACSACAGLAQAQTPVPAAPIVPVQPSETNLAWWSPIGNPAFVVEFVGQAAGQPAIVVRFSRDAGAPATASKFIRLLDDAGNTVPGDWQAGNVPSVLVRSGLTPGRYTIIFDPRLANARGDLLNALLAGQIVLR